MYQSCSNASSWYVAGRGGSGLDDWSYPNFHVLSRPPPACCWLAQHCNHWFFTWKKKEGEECSQERKERWIDSGTERGMKAGSVVALSCLWARSAPLIAKLPRSPSLSLLVSLLSSRSLSLFPWESTCWENLYELLGLSAILGLLKNLPV